MNFTHVADPAKIRSGVKVTQFFLFVLIRDSEGMLNFKCFCQHFHHQSLQKILSAPLTIRTNKLISTV